MAPLIGDVRFDDVHFTYPNGRAALTGIDAAKLGLVQGFLVVEAGIEVQRSGDSGPSASMSPQDLQQHAVVRLFLPDIASGPLRLNGEHRKAARARPRESAAVEIHVE